MQSHPLELISNLRGKFQGDREAIIKHLIDTGHERIEAIDIANRVQREVKEDEEEHKNILEENLIILYKVRFGVLSDKAREEAFVKTPTNDRKVLENLNELIDLIPTVPARKHPGLNLIWMATIGALIKEDEFNNYATELITTANAYINRLRKAQEKEEKS